MHWDSYADLHRATRTYELGIQDFPKLHPGSSPHYHYGLSDSYSILHAPRSILVPASLHPRSFLVPSSCHPRSILIPSSFQPRSILGPFPFHPRCILGGCVFDKLLKQSLRLSDNANSRRIFAITSESIVAVPCCTLLQTSRHHYTCDGLQIPDAICDAGSAVQH